MKTLFILCLLTILSISLVSSQNEKEFDEVNYRAPNPANSFFFDNFNEDSLNKVWIPSRDAKYTGEWKYSSAVGSLVGISGDKGLLLTDEAKHYAISTQFKKPFDNTDKDLVLQYEVKFETDQGMSCGGAYLKLLSTEAFSSEAFNNDSPYIIMFGPDKCGSSDKVHFIFRHQNPKSKAWEEKHLKTPPSIKNDQLTHLYTLIVRKDNTFEILIDEQSVRKGNLLEDFEPSVNPPKEIDDPNDKKPADWIDNEMMDDPAAKKPEDWDETQPEKIVDVEDKKPEGWLDNGPAKIPDPNAKKPEDWNDEEDGKWEAPTVDNPECQRVGCGEWKPREIPNPKYKGKWVPPKIKNPLYKGVWAPRKIANPNYFVDEHPHNFPKIGAIGIEIWTMTKNILFDNILISHDENSAKEYAQKTFSIKSQKEKEKQPKPTSGTNDFNKAIQQVLELINQYPVPVFTTLALMLLSIPILFCVGCRMFGGETKKEKKVDDLKKEKDNSTKTEEKKEEDKPEEVKTETKTEEKKEQPKIEEKKEEIKKEEVKPEEKKEEKKEETKKEEVKPEEKKEDAKVEEKKDIKKNKNKNDKKIDTKVEQKEEKRVDTPVPEEKDIKEKNNKKNKKNDKKEEKKEEAKVEEKKEEAKVEEKAEENDGTPIENDSQENKKSESKAKKNKIKKI